MPSPTESELRLLRRLWSDGRQSARELHDSISEATGWSFSTTRKLLDRLTEKGLVAVSPVHGVKTYVAEAPRLATLAGLIKTFARDILDADGPIPAATFAGSRMIDEDDIEELERLLNDSVDGDSA